MPAAADGVARGLDRAGGCRPIPGNALVHHPDAPRALDAMLEAVAGARRVVHFENYIIRDDRTGRRFADALAARARAGVRVRVLYDALGSRATSRRYWSALRRAGAEVRAFNPAFTLRPLRLLRRDHRKLVAVDGARAFVGGLCIGDEWAGDPARGKQPWRDTVLEIRGPAATALDNTFARVWRRAGPPIPADETAPDAPECGAATVRVIEEVPEGVRAWRVVQLLAATATERLWIADAYLVAPTPLYAALVDAAAAGVDVRLLLPGATDIRLVQAFTRIGYRALLEAGVRLFEWRGPMLHAKVLLADRRWVRVGSSNINVSSLIENYELDVLTDDVGLAREVAERFRVDLADTREVVLAPRRLRAPKLAAARATADGAEAGDAPRERGLRERRAAAVVLLRQVAGGLRQRLAVVGALVAVAGAALLVAFPAVAGAAVAALLLVISFTLAWYAVAKRPRETDPDVP